jgi:hypothetical protein
MERARIRWRETDFPWLNIAEDREVVHDALTGLYARLGLKRPRFTWARSPFAMMGAIRYMREMQTGTKGEAIKAMVKGLDPIEAEIRSVFLDGIIDQNLSVTTGACLKNTLMGPNTSHTSGLLPIKELAENLAQQFGNYGRVAGWKDWALYPVWHEFNYALRTQTLCIIPFVHVCWISRPPVMVKTDDEGHLHCADGPAVRFADGFEVWAEYKKPEELTKFMPEPGTYGAAERKPSKTLQGKSAMEMLREAAAEKSMRGLPAPKEDSDASK